MLGLVVLLWGTVLVSASPLQQADYSGINMNNNPDFKQVVRELINSDISIKAQLLSALKDVAATQENLQKFLLGGSEVNLSCSDSNSDCNSNWAFFTRSVVAAINTGNNTQLDAILMELKRLNLNFDKRFETNPCSEPFMKFGEECFNFQLEDLTWEESRQRCLQLGGDLAIPKNLTAVRLFIGENFPRKNRRNFWLGGTENNKVWEWLSGDAVNSELWHVNEPSGNGDCLAMFDGWEKPLSDFPCENQRRAICEHIYLH